MRNNCLMSKEALKFFYAYIREMIDTGGEKFPKTISTRLGVKLAEVYRNKGIDSLESAIAMLYRAFNAKCTMKKIDDSTYEITIKHRQKSCPIGGKVDPKLAKMIQESICYPYTKSFFQSLFPSYNFDGEVKRCILMEGNRYCSYILKMNKK